MSALPALKYLEQREPDALGLPGKLDWIPAATPNCDYSYQRPLSRYQVNKLKREFDPDLLGVMLISQRPDGSLWVLDGQHRLTALVEMERGSALVPAMIYHHLDLQTEAKVFAQTNKNRLYLSPNYAFRARLLAGDKIATTINEIVQGRGFHINYWKSLPGQSPGMARPEGMLTCVGEIESVYTDFHDTQMLTTTLGVIADAWGTEVIGLTAAILRGVAIFLHNFSRTMDRERLITIMARTSPTRLLNDARDIGAGNSPSAVTLLLIRRYNLQLGAKNRLHTTGLLKAAQHRG